MEMTFVDELPGRVVQTNSKKVVDALKAQPGKWGEFSVQNAEQEAKAARQRATSFKNYVKRHELPIEVRTITAEDGLIHCWARYQNGDGTS